MSGGWSGWKPKKFELKIDVYKDFDTKIDTDIDVDYNLDLDIDKDIDVKVDIYTDIDLDDNVAITTGLAENDSKYDYLEVTTAAQTVDDTQSVANTEVLALGSQTTFADMTAGALGPLTYAELDVQVHITDKSHVISWMGEAASD